MKMNELLREMNNVLGPHEGSRLSLGFYSDGSIAFYVYEQEIPIVIDKENKVAYFDSSITNDKLTGDMLHELSVIAKLIDENIDVILSCY